MRSKSEPETKDVTKAWALLAPPAGPHDRLSAKDASTQPFYLPAAGCNRRHPWRSYAYSRATSLQALSSMGGGPVFDGGKWLAIHQPPFDRPEPWRAIGR